MTVLYSLLLVIITLIVHKAWIDPNNTLFFGDWKYRNDKATGEIFSAWGQSTWSGFYEFGGANIQPYTNLYTFFWGIIGKYDLAVRITLMWPIMILSVLAPFFLCLKFTKNHAASFLAALFYGFNTYILIKQGGHLLIAFVYSLAPFIILAFDSMMQKRSVASVVPFALLYTLGCSYELRIMYIVTWILLFYYIVFYFSEIKRNWKPIAICISLVVLLSSFFVFPLLAMDKGAISAVANRGLWGDHLFSLINSLSFFDWHWTGSQPVREFINQQISWYFWITPILIMIPLIMQKKDNTKVVYFFYGLLILGLLLSKQSAPPFETLYEWLYLNFPGFNLFRLSAKFYIILSLSGCILLAFSFTRIFNVIKNNIIKGILIILISILFLFNAKPLLSEEFAGLFFTREQPTDYQYVEDIIKDEDLYFRTLWVPTYDNWAYYDIMHPKVHMWKTKSYLLKYFSDKEPNTGSFSDPLLYTSVFDSLPESTILENMMVKYIILPREYPHDLGGVFPYAGNRDEYKKALDDIPYLTNIYSNEVDIYEYKLESNYIEALTDIYNIEDKESYDMYINHIDSNTSAGFILNEENQSKKLLPQFHKVQVLINNFIAFGSRIYGDFNNIVSTGSKTNVYFQDFNKKIIGTMENNTLSLLFSNFLFGEDSLGINIQTDNLLSLSTDSEKKYYTSYQNTLLEVKEDTLFDIGFIPPKETLNIFSTGKKDVSILTFGEDTALGNCRKHDDNPEIDLDIQKSGGNNIFQLSATRHVACISKSIDITDETPYLFTFSHSTPSNSDMGYYISFNDENKTVKKGRISSSKEWSNLKEMLDIPKGATKMKVYFYSYETDKEKTNIVRYKDIDIQKISLEKGIQILSYGEEKRLYNMGQLRASNISDFSIPLKDKVSISPIDVSLGNCRRYDDHPNIGLNFISEGREDIFELSATRHVACISKKFDVQDIQYYLFKFSHLSPNSSSMGYYISFDDENKTIIKDKNISTKEWETEESIIKIPSGSKNMKVYFYSYESDKIEKNIVRYKNIEFQEVPSSIYDIFYLQKPGITQLEIPKSTSWEFINASKKNITIGGAKTSFYISMSEKYHKQWQLMFNNSKTKGTLYDWIPFIKPDVILNDNHFEINGFLNGWFIDIEEHCIKNQLCILNKDGTYDLELTVEFSPQRWFYLGSIITGIMLLLSFSFLIYTMRIFYKNLIKKND